jgi:Protein of unknown function (DUF669)
MLDLTNVATDSGFDTLPPGQYSVQVEKAEMKTTKAGNGEYINCQFTILDGAGVGRKIFHTFNTKNPNEKAVQIGLGQLKSFMTCAGKKDPNSLKSVEDLLGLSALATVKIEKSEDYGDKNKITSFKPLSAKPIAASTASANPFV